MVGWDTDGDGLADVGPFEDAPDGGVVVPFNGFGRIRLRFNPDNDLPNGLMLPVKALPLVGTYKEGHL